MPANEPDDVLVGLAAAATNLQKINLKSDKPPFGAEVTAIRNAMKEIIRLRKLDRRAPSGVAR